MAVKHRAVRRAQFGKRDSPVPPQEIECGIGGDARKPVRRLLFVFDLILPLQGFNESFLGKILRIMHIAHNAVNLAEDPLHVLGDEPLLQIGRVNTGLQKFHACLCRKNLHSCHIDVLNPPCVESKTCALSLKSNYATGCSNRRGQNALRRLSRQRLKDVSGNSGRKSHSQCRDRNGSDRGVLPRQFRRPGIHGTESSGPICCHRAGHGRYSRHTLRSSLRLKWCRLLSGVARHRQWHVRHGDGRRRREDDEPAHGSRNRNSRRCGRLFHRSQGRVHLPVPVRHGGPAPYAPVRHHARTPVVGCCKEPRKRRAQS